MSNEIRPRADHVGASEDVVLQIAVESAVDRFTWVIIDADDGQIIAGDRVDRLSNHGTSRGQGFSIVVTETHERFAQDYGGVELAAARRLRNLKDQQKSHDFEVRLFNGHPQKSGSVETRFGELDLLDEGAFSITGRDDMSPIDD